MKNIEKFINELIRVGKSNNTVAAYRTDIRQFKEWLYTTSGIYTDNITKIDLKQYVQYMIVNLNFKGNTINRKVKSIVQYTKFLNNTELSTTIVDTVGLKMHSDCKAKAKLISKRDLYTLKMVIYYCDNKRDIAIFEILINTGLRCNELIGIEIDDLNIDILNNDSYIDLKTAKGKNRLVPLKREAVTAIIEYIKVRPLSMNNRLLQGQRGSITRLAINKLLERYSKQSMIELVTPNMFRNTVLNDMLEKGIDIKEIRELLGYVSTLD